MQVCQADLISPQSILMPPMQGLAALETIKQNA